MKRNMLAIVILAATLVNIALTALMLFTVIPKAQRTDALIQKICTIIDIELEDPNAADYVEIPFEDRETYNLANKITVNLAKPAGSSKSPYAQVEVTLMLNKKADSYATIQPLLVNYESIIRNIVSEEVSKYTIDELDANKDAIQKMIWTRLSTEFGNTELLIGVVLNWTYDSK